MNDLQIRNRYFFYTILQTFTQKLFFAFGALLIYSKTHSIPIVLLYGLSGSSVSLFMKSYGFNIVTYFMRRFGFVATMVFGLMLNTSCYSMIFLLNTEMTLFYLFLFLCGALGSIGSSIYNVCGSTLQLQIIGNSKTPGLSAASIDVMKTASGLLAVMLGIILNNYGLFEYSFLIGALMLLMSTLPLHGIPNPKVPLISFKDNIKKIPKAMLWANFNPDHEIAVTAVPLAILLLSASLKLSANVNASIAIFSIVLAYGSGMLKDRNKIWVVWLMLAIGVISWTSFVFVKTPLSFIVPTVIISIIMNILTLYRESRMGPFMRNTDNYLGATFAIEFMRTLGGLVATALILLVYLSLETLPIKLLAVSWVFLLPLALYGANKYRTALESVEI